MFNGILLLLAFGISLLGMSWLALSLPANYKQVTKTYLSKPYIWRLRALGYTGLLMALLLCFYVDRPSMAALVFVMLQALSAFIVSMVLGYRPGWLVWVSPWRKAQAC